MVYNHTRGVKMAKENTSKKKKKHKKMDSQKLFAYFCLGIMVLSVLSSIIIYLI